MESDDYLQHWGLKKGEQRKNHKYFKRIESGNPKHPYIYFYTQAEYQAYLKTGKVPKNKSGSSSSTKASNKKSSLSKSTGKSSSLLSNLQDTINRKLSDFKRVVDKDGNGRWDLVDSVAKEIGKQKTKSRQKKAKKNKDAAIKELYSKEHEKYVKARDKEDKKINENGHPKEPQNHKYIAKILVNGKYRYFYHQEELNAFYTDNPEYSDDEVMSEFDTISEEQTEEESQSKINPNFKAGMHDGFSTEPGWQSNCYDCTLTYEARRRGYDVEAIYDTNGSSYAQQAKFYEGVKSPIVQDESGTVEYETDKNGNAIGLKRTEDSGWDYPSNSKPGEITRGKEQWDQLDKDLTDKYPDGARGNLCVQWRGGSGHSMAWEKKDGKIYIHDAQTNETVEMSECNYGRRVADYDGACVALRTDDKKFTKEAANYLQPADNEDEAKGNSRLTFTTDEIDAYVDYMKNGYIRKSQKADTISYYQKVQDMADINDDASIDEIYNGGEQEYYG